VANVKRVLGVPEHIIPMCVISVGYPAEIKADISDQKYEPEKIHYERW
jgi:nitroreductase